MTTQTETETGAAKAPTQTERTSEREVVVTRLFNGPVRIVFKAWSTPALFQRWWVPKESGMTLISCEMDVRTGGGYRLEFGHPAFDQPVPFFGKYLEVVPEKRMVWTNEEGEDEGAVTTVTFEDRGAQTLVVVHDLYPSKDALDAAIESGATSGFDSQFQQLDELLAELGA